MFNIFLIYYLIYIFIYFFIYFYTIVIKKGFLKSTFLALIRNLTVQPSTPTVKINSQKAQQCVGQPWLLLPRHSLQYFLVMEIEFGIDLPVSSDNRFQTNKLYIHLLERKLNQSFSFDCQYSNFTHAKSVVVSCSEDDLSNTLWDQWDMRSSVPKL